MKLRSAVVWGGAGCGRRAMAAAHSRAESGHSRHRRAPFGHAGRCRAESGHSKRRRAPFGHLRRRRATFRHFQGSERPNLARRLPYCPKCARQCGAVRISPDNPRVVRIVPDNASTAQISPGNAAAQPRHDRRANPPAPHRQLRTASADPQPDRSAAKSSSPSHRHPRSRCAGCPLPCNRPPGRRSCLSAQSAQDCIQPS